MTPWDKIKTDPEHAHATVSVLTYLIKNIAIAIEPYMPETAARTFKMLNLPKLKWKSLGSFSGLDKHIIGNPEILYKKLNKKLAEKFRKKFSGEQPDFGKFRIVVGQITKVKIHPDASHLYHLTVDLGEEKERSIVAGLVKHYSPEELTGRKVFVLANLKSSELRGVLSEGMVLVCEKRNKMELLNASAFSTGDQITVEDQTIDHTEISIDQFKTAPMRIVNSELFFDDQQCRVNNLPVTTQMLQSGKVR